MATANLSETETDKATCPFCLDIFLNPRRISCGHTFCKSCLDPYFHVQDPKCPLCRIRFDPGSNVPDEKMNLFLQTHKAACTGCKKQMLLVQLKAHSIYCPDVQESLRTLCGTDVNAPMSPALMRSNRNSGQACLGAAAQPLAIGVPNRSTFHCPFCSERNLDSTAMLQHCNARHRQEDQKVVCPICAAMPWGNPNQRSGNFLEHIGMRHKFEYARYVDFAKTEDEMLTSAIEKSFKY